MPYTAEISRVNPSCFLFLIDQSGSMADPWGSIEEETTRTKADELATIVNRTLQNLVVKCAKSEGVRDYYHVGVIGYGASVGPAFAGSLAGRDLIPISEIAETPARVEERTKKVEDGLGGLVDQTVKFPIWFDPVANNGTPMCQALDYSRGILSNWLTDHADCFPPVILHITDGESTDGNPTEAMSELGNLSSSDGNSILFNIHLSSNPKAKQIEFPDSAESLPDQYAELLFNGASHMTPFMRQVANAEYEYNLSDQARTFVLNADPALVIKALDIGTRPSNLR